MRKAPRLTTLFGAGLIALSGLVGCKQIPSVVTMGKFRGYDVRLIVNSERIMWLADSTGYLHVIDEAPYDGRFDDIKSYVPKGHPLKNYANPDSLELAYETILEEYLSRQGRSRSGVPKSLVDYF